MKIVADEEIPYIEEYFGSEGEVVRVKGRELNALQVRDADLLFVRSISPVNANLLQGSSVKFVGTVTAGADHLDTAYLAEADIHWSTAAGFNAPPVADYVVCVVAALQRQDMLGVKARVAIIGVGEVGKRVAESLIHLGFDIVYCDPFRAHEDADFIHTPLEEIADVDMICLHVPLTKNGDYPTYHFLTAEFLSRQKPGTVLLNASRGAVINTDTLLSAGSPLTKCLDVWEHEPTPDPMLLEQAFIATPHIAGYSVQSKWRGVEMIYRAVCDAGILAGREIIPTNATRHTMEFSERATTWQEIVLGVFNPILLTALMRAKLSVAAEPGPQFDELRASVNYRQEFRYVNLVANGLQPQDRQILQSLGFVLS